MHRKLYKLENLLLHLSPEDVDYSEMTETDVIKIFVNNFGRDSIMKTIQEGAEVLNMEPFPWEWVQDVSQTLVYDEEKKQWVEDPIIYKKWLTKILMMLEEEALKVGQLDKAVLKLK